MNEETPQPEPAKDNPRNLPENFRSPQSGTFPPMEHCFKKGDDTNRNMKGQNGKSWGLSKYLQFFKHADYNERRLSLIAKNKKAPVNKRAAALQMLRMIENPDLADFTEVLSGELSLRAARRKGVRTRCIKKLKVKVRKTKVKDGEVEEIIEREIELFDRAPAAFDRVSNRTEGTPTQKLEIKAKLDHTHTLIEEIRRDPESQRLAEQLAARLDPTPHIN